MEVGGINNEWTDSNLENFTDAEFGEILQDDKDLQQFIAAMDIGEGVNMSDGMLFNSASLNSVEGFDQQSFSASDLSLADQYSPTTTTYSSLSGYGDQYSPSTGSIDSGLPNDFADSPILSPDTLSLDYQNAQLPDGTQQSLEGILPPGGMNNQEISSQLIKIIQQQVQQALSQQQQLQQQQQPSQDQQQTQVNQIQTPEIQLQEKDNLDLEQSYQQRMALLQQQKLLNQRNAQLIHHEMAASKNDSQLRKMLLQTKNNIAQTKNTIMNSLHDKKEKIQKVFPKPGNIISKPGIIKPGKRKIHGIPHEEIKEEKIPALLNNSFDAMVTSRNKNLNFAGGTTGNIETLVLQQKKSPVEIPQMISTLSPSIDPSTVISGLESKSKERFETIPTTTTYTVPSLQAPGKVQINRLKTSNNFQHKPHKVKKSSESKKMKAECKRSRVEHVIIEKRYRMKITDSLNELKQMLPGADDKKATKNTILQAAIEEINRLRKHNDTLRRRFDKMRKVFEDLKSVGILTTTQCISSSSSESDDCTSTENTSSASDTTSGSLEPEVNQDHYASPFQRQSARDGVKSVTCFALFLFLFVNPLTWLAAGKSSPTNDGTTFSSRHLLNIREQETSPEFSLMSSLVNIVMSLFILMIMVLRGNPKCHKSSKLAHCFKSQYRKAQRKVNRHDYEAAKGSLRIGLFLIGNSCPKTFYGQLASFSWKCLCHMLYQLGILTTLQTIGHRLLPAAICLSDEKEEREFAGKMSAKAYKKLHEISMKDPNSTYLESACYIMNAIYAAEVSCDKEMLCTVYATAVVHMRERLWNRMSSFPQYYFTACAHHVSLASKEGPFAIDWIFESRGYEFFSSDLWDINRRTVFSIENEEANLDENDLLQIVFVQFQEHLLTKALKRIVTPNGSYPNEGKIELRQRSLSYLEDLGSGPMSEQVDAVAVHYHTLYAWWGNTLKQLINIFKNSSIDDDDMMTICTMFEDIHEQHRHPLVSLAEATISSYCYIRNMKDAVERMKIVSSDLEEKRYEVQERLFEASEMIDRLRANVSCAPGSDQEIEELIFILCCELVIDSHYLLWQYKPDAFDCEQELNFLVNENTILQSYALRYPELASKVQCHDSEIQYMSGSNQGELSRILKKTQFVKTTSHGKQMNSFYFDSNE